MFSGLFLVQKFHIKKSGVSLKGAFPSKKLSFTDLSQD